VDTAASGEPLGEEVREAPDYLKERLKGEWGCYPLVVTYGNVTFLAESEEQLFATCVYIVKQNLSWIEIESLNSPNTLVADELTYEQEDALPNETFKAQSRRIRRQNDHIRRQRHREFKESELLMSARLGDGVAALELLDYRRDQEDEWFEVDHLETVAIDNHHAE